MSEIKDVALLIRDRDRTMRLRSVSDWDVYTMLGALSADPISMDELSRAWLRYRPDQSFDSFAWESPESWSQPERDWYLIDIPNRHVVVGGDADLPLAEAAYSEFSEEEIPCRKENPIVWIHSPSSWTIERGDWPKSPPEIEPMHEPTDFRGVLYGRAFSDWVAQATLKTACDDELPSEYLDANVVYQDRSLTPEEKDTANWWYDLTLKVHRDWLLTARSDLDGETPREFLHRDRLWVQKEIDVRRRQWLDEGQLPRGVDANTFAYRFGPMGLNEVVVYFDFCRAVINHAWERIAESPQIDFGCLADHLQAYGLKWLGTEDRDGLSPSVVIDHERRRIPLTDQGGHADDDCPVCRMMPQGGSPTFIMYDGHHLELDGEFAFALDGTPEDWAMYSDDTDGSFAPSAPHMLEPKRAGKSENAIWQFSFVDPNEPLTALSLAMRLSEVIGDLQMKDAGGDAIREINEAFDAYRQADGDEKAMQTASRHLAKQLEKAAGDHPDLVAKAADFQSLVAEHIREKTPGPH